ncbi:MAG: 5-formyltetrahydrofolate cyclo-ligase [Solobacterium sp.]|nr:5-formyltetrahydrofolate cyclo-ligase [Solobacterium sp.]
MSAEKQERRKQLRERQRTLTQEYRQSAGERITAHVLVSDLWKQADKVFVYLSMPSEPDTSVLIWEALRTGKQVFVPKCFENGRMEAVRITPDSLMKPSAYGIPEPVEDTGIADPQMISLVIVPCLSVSADGVRLGHGKGYYDRWLQRSGAKTICLCFEQMMEDDIPHDAYDICMMYVTTEQGIRKAGQ